MWQTYGFSDYQWHAYQWHDADTPDAPDVPDSSGIGSCVDFAYTFGI